MAELQLEGDELVLHLSGMEKAEAVHGDLRVPLSTFRGVEVLGDAHSWTGIGCCHSLRLAWNSSTLRGPGIIAATAGCARGNCNAAAARGTRWVSHTALMASTRLTTAGGAVL